MKEFWSGRRYAIVGVSRFRRKFGNSLYREMTKRDYEVFPVNRKGGDVEGTLVFSRLRSIPQLIDGVIVVVPPLEALQIVKECADLHINKVWLQPGSESEDVIHLCRDDGINPIVKTCALLYVEPRKLPHSFHYLLYRIFGGKS
jgi:predicted CoA-binding protein